MHMKMHTGERPFIFKTCGKGYVRNANLRMHASTWGNHTFAKNTERLSLGGVDEAPNTTHR